LKKLTVARARKVLGLPSRGPFTEERLQSSCREAAKAAHPDAGGTDELFIEVNEARTFLLPRTSDFGESRPRPAASSVVLTITPDGHLLSPKDHYLGDCRSVAGGIAYCAASGWSYQKTAELSDGQRRVLEAAA